ncbi:hypothetical protein JL722_9305 [Aureococcus anophagefferens]|nr:hypothetical protein JL722_9305 [Aureococcus anophagefferens]
MTALAERNSWAAEGLDDRDACGSGIATVALGDDEPRLVRTLRGHRGGAVNSVSFSPSKKQLASGGADSCVMLWHFGPASHVNVWDARSHGLIQHYASHAGPITSIAMEPRAGHYLASSGDDGTLKLYDLRQGQVLYTPRPRGGGGGLRRGPRTASSSRPAARTRSSWSGAPSSTAARPSPVAAKPGARKARRSTSGNKTPAPHHPAVFEPKSLAPPVLPASTHAPTLAPPPPPVARRRRVASGAAAGGARAAADPTWRTPSSRSSSCRPTTRRAPRAVPARAAAARPPRRGARPDRAGAARGVDRAMLPGRRLDARPSSASSTSYHARDPRARSITEDRVSTILKSKTEAVS